MIWRFAPSPTGALHLGSLRIALFNYIQAHKVNGSVILRIEDTDQKRLVQGSAESISSILDWIGIKFNNKCIQSERLPLYKGKVDELFIKDHAYRCFCTKEDLEDMRLKSMQKKIQFRYDQRCRHLTREQIQDKVGQGQQHVVRFKAPQVANVQFKDLVYGDLRFGQSNIDDVVLLKSDGWPTYHLANVVDDHDMKVDHVIRGQEWISSTPKHILLYKAFGWDIPTFAHLPLLLNKDGSKLSKRQDDLSIQSLKDQGYFPEAIVSFVAFLGWGKNENRILSLPELIQEFDVSKLSKSSCVVSLEKLESLNKMCLLKKMEDPIQLKELIQSIRAEIDKCNWEMSDESRILYNDKNYFKSLVIACKDRVRKVPDFKHYLKPFFISFDQISNSNLQELERLDVDTRGNFFSKSIAIVQDCKNYLNSKLESELLVRHVAKANNVSLKSVSKILRILLTNEAVIWKHLIIGWP